MDEAKVDWDAARSALEKHYGSREGMLVHNLIYLSTLRQPCDVTFYKRGPILDVTVDQELGLALMYGAGDKRLRAMLSKLKLSSGDVINFTDIWTINPMPKGGISAAELEGVMHLEPGLLRA